jgi:hypothetical protein
LLGDVKSDEVMRRIARSGGVVIPSKMYYIFMHNEKPSMREFEPRHDVAIKN